MNPNGETFPKLPDVSGSAAAIAAIAKLPAPAPPEAPEKLFQETGLRRSRALPYELHVWARMEPAESKLTLIFRNSGEAGAVFHVYDKLHLDRIPRRYTVEPSKPSKMIGSLTLTTDAMISGSTAPTDLCVNSEAHSEVRRTRCRRSILSTTAQNARSGW